MIPALHGQPKHFDASLFSYQTLPVLSLIVLSRMGEGSATTVRRQPGKRYGGIPVANERLTNRRGWRFSFDPLVGWLRVIDMKRIDVRRWRDVRHRAYAAANDGKSEAAIDGSAT